MDTYTIAKIAFWIIASIAGSGGIVWWFVQLSANTLADNYKRKIQHEFEVKLEGYKSQLEILQATMLKYKASQFDLYINLWKNLQELKFACNDLWETADKSNLRKFHNALIKTHRQVETSSILIEESQYLDLIEVIKKFQEYNSGKKKIVQEWNSAEPFEIENMKEHNRERKDTCLAIIDRMKGNIRDEIKGIK
jgi:hypothetical protein